MSSLKQLIPSPVDRYIRRKINAYRQATAERRGLPDFIIIGAQKSGTTSLFEYLAKHPQIIPSAKKEVHFFDKVYEQFNHSPEKAELWYRSNFPLKDSSQTITFEASPYYMFHPLVPERIYKLLPKVKIIALLRNPTERALSHYFHSRKKGRESLPVMEALQAEEKRLLPYLKEKNYNNKPMHYFSYKLRGHYAEQLQRYFKFFPEEQILILRSESFFSNPQDNLGPVFKFVGVDPDFKPSRITLTRKNRAKNRIPVSEEVYKYLNDYFEPSNKELFRLAGHQFNWQTTVEIL